MEHAVRAGASPYRRHGNRVVRKQRLPAWFERCFDPWIDFPGSLNCKMIRELRPKV
jgi:hypothetical protein